jgi:hypothetical protein
MDYTNRRLYITRPRTFLAALMAVGVLLCACHVSPSSPPTPAAQRMRHSPASDNHHRPSAPESPNTDDDSTAKMASMAVVGGMMLLQQQEERRETCPTESCESNPGPFLKLQTN